MVAKVAAFIVRRSGVNAQLLVFAHADLPEVPVQIPGGTVEPGESPENAVLREVEEESGLRGLPILHKLGVCHFFWTAIDDEIERHCYLLQAPNDAPDSWQHTVGGAGEDGGLVFSYFWEKADNLNLGGGLDVFLSPEHIPELYER